MESRSETRRKRSSLKPKTRAGQLDKNGNHLVKKRDQLDKNRVQLYQCWCCLKTFEQEALRRQHMRQHDPSLQTFPCSQCQIIFPSNLSYKIHLKSGHQIPSKLKEPEVFEKQQAFSFTEQSTWNQKKVYEAKSLNELNFPARTPTIGCQDDSTLRIESTFSLKQKEFREVWPVEFIDIESDLQYSEEQKDQLCKNSSSEFLDNERLQHQQQAYCPSSTLTYTNSALTNNNNYYFNSTMDSDKLEVYDVDDDDVDDFEGSDEELSICDVKIIEDVDDDIKDDFVVRKIR